MKNLNNIIIVLLSLTCLTLFVAATQPKIKEQNKPIDIKITASNDARYIIKYISVWSKLGYKVHSLTPQSVSTSISHRDIKGDLILIMIK